jgi:hypothetical protein
VNEKTSAWGRIICRRQPAIGSFRASLDPTFEFVLLGLTLAIALGFEFVNGFHDTANAVAAVISTHSLEPHLAVVWSGLWNFIGVLTSSGAVAFGIVSLLPVELILNAGTHAGFAMIFALLVSAILWNLGTWYFGLPNSSSHTLIGSILGVGLMNLPLRQAALHDAHLDCREDAPRYRGRRCRFPEDHVGGHLHIVIGSGSRQDIE